MISPSATRGIRDKLTVKLVGKSNSHQVDIEPVIIIYIIISLAVLHERRAFKLKLHLEMVVKQAFVTLEDG